VVTDDQRADTLFAMPTVNKELVRHGVRFTKAFVVNPLCCPSRASILTGKYSHSTGVWRNAFPNGGFKDDSTTIATVLQQAGYRTALMGKYLNGYESAANTTKYVPPGWDRWVAFARGLYYNYRLNIDGVLKDYGDRPYDYSTNALRRQAMTFIRNTEGPLFLYFVPYAPHDPATPAQRHEKEFSDLPPFRPPSYNEADVSDKPEYIRQRPRLRATDRAAVDAFRLGQLRSLLAVDRAIDGILEALSETGRLDDSLIILTSDNGMALGEHRWRKAKRIPYEESVRVPLVVRWDRRFQNARDEDRFALNIDLAPTIAGVTGLSLPDADGQSLAPLLEASTEPWRDAFLIEHLTDARPFAPSYCAVRTRRYVYAVYATGERELYDLEADPHELKSEITDPPASELRDRLRQLCVPKPPGFDVEI
jgi:arylsulfatase A-like enzyme